jgi:hypothetical protein
LDQSKVLVNCPKHLTLSSIMVQVVIKVVVVNVLQLCMLFLPIPEHLADPGPATAAHTPKHHLRGRQNVILSVQDGKGAAHRLAHTRRLSPGGRTECNQKIVRVMLADLHLAIRKTFLG